MPNSPHIPSYPYIIYIFPSPTMLDIRRCSEASELLERQSSTTTDQQACGDREGIIRRRCGVVVAHHCSNIELYIENYIDMGQ